MFALLDSGKEAFRARVARDFQSMSLPDKLIDLSLVFAPVVLACSTLRKLEERQKLEERHQTSEFWLVAAYVALFPLVKLNVYVQGYLALRRGIQPECPATELNSRTATQDMILDRVQLAAGPLAALVYVYFVPSSRQWSTAVFVYLWLALLSNYQRTRRRAMQFKGPESDLFIHHPAIQ